MFLPEQCKNCVYITLKLFFKFSRERSTILQREYQQLGFPIAYIQPCTYLLFVYGMGNNRPIPNSICRYVLQIFWGGKPNPPKNTNELEKNLKDEVGGGYCQKSKLLLLFFLFRTVQILVETSYLYASKLLVSVTQNNRGI